MSDVSHTNQILASECRLFGVREKLVSKTHCCFPSCRSKGLFLLRCEQMCSSQCTDTSCQRSHACKSKENNIWWCLLGVFSSEPQRANNPVKMSCSHLKLRWDWLFGWKWSHCCPLFPFIGTYKHHPPVFCPTETETKPGLVVMYWTVLFHLMYRFTLFTFHVTKTS